MAGDATATAARVAQVLMGLYACQELVSVTMAIRRRNLQPLKFRDAILLTVTDLSFFGFVQGNVLSVMLQTDCLTLTLSTIPFLVAMPALVGRLWRLLALSMVTSARVAGKFDHFLLRNTWAYSSGAIWAGIVLASVTMSAIRVGMLLSVHCDEPTNIRDPVFGAIWVLTVAFLARSLRSTTDAFHAMTEFKALFVMVGVGFVLVVPDMAIASVGRLVNPYYYFQLVFLVVGMSWNAISVVYPTYLTYKFKQTHHVDTNTALDSPLQCAMMDQAGVPRLTIDSRLADALKHPVGYELFKDYLTTEFSVENLLCWSSVTSIIKDCEQRAAIPPEEFNKTFNDFYKMYIATGCPNEVNISHAARGRLRKYAGGRARASLAASVLPLQTVVVAVDDGYHGRVSALRELQREVFKLMESDSFARFKQSKEFAKLIAEQQ